MEEKQSCSGLMTLFIAFGIIVRLTILMHAFESGCMKRLANIFDHVFNIFEFLDLLIRKLNIEVIVNCDRDIDHVDFIEF
jgi:hypothetical protein